VVDATATDVIIAAPIAFGLGMLAGWLIASRYRVVKRPDRPSGVFEVPPEMRGKDANHDT
jgi:hypothetical protein